MAVVQVRDVFYRYPGAEGVEALAGITFDAAENEFLSVVGPSGCGKSTLLRLLADLLPLKTGDITIDRAPARMARQRRQIGFVFQDPALMPWRTSLKNVRLPLEVLKRKGDSEGLLQLVGLHEFADKRPEQLSGGMRQRVSIARALTYDPHLLLMDEPFGSLDQITRDEMNQELLKIWERRRSTVIFVTHSILEALYLSDRVIVLTPRPGRIIDIVDVPFARPRQPSLRRTPEFFQVETKLLAALEGQAAISG